MLLRGKFLLLATRSSIRVVFYGRDQEKEWLGVFRKDTLFPFYQADLCVSGKND